jgi:hypothetical protein
MAREIQRLWEATEWQTFALRLVQLRHGGGQNVQPVPDEVQGDAGIEFFTTDGTLYQCYAPEDPSSVAKAASAMKGKGRRDLGKLVEYQTTIASLLQGLKIKRWILLCPFLDDKSVIASIRSKGEEIAASGLGFIDPSFEALVQSQTDFLSELELIRQQSLGPMVAADLPTAEAIEAQSGNLLSQTLLAKLAKAFPAMGPAELQKKERGYVRAYMIRENLFEKLRRNHPIVWERSNACISAEEDRLATVGLNASLPNAQLIESLTNVERLLERDIAGINRAALTQIAIGTVSDWLMRCPLDFDGPK